MLHLFKSFKPRHAFACVLLSVMSGSALATDENPYKMNFPVEKFVLDNGLTVLLQEDHSSPIVSYHTWFRVGSRNERPGITGIAHMFEHLMFKGTERFKDGDFDKILQANGADNNAFTNHDYTGYYENFPSSKLELIMDIEADRMVHLKLTPEMFSAEREVVKEERRLRVDNSPMGALEEMTFETMFKKHPYRWPVIGWMNDISSYKLEDFAQWYKTFYAPNNAIVVISGDIDSSQVKRWIKKYYGSIPSQVVPVAKFEPEASFKGPKTVTLAKPLQSSSVTLNFHSAPLNSRESLALDLAGLILADGESSRLYKKYVYSLQKATQVSAFNYSPLDAGLFTITVALKPGLSGESVKESLFSDVRELAKKGVTEKELVKAKNKALLGQIRTMSTAYGRGYTLASAEYHYGDYKKGLNIAEEYNSITQAEVLSAVQKYLKIEQSAFMILKPK